MRLPTPPGSPSCSTKDGRSALHDDVYKNDVESVRTCLSGNDVDVNVVDAKGRTPLFYAALFNRCEILELLLTAGCDVNVTDVDKNTALHEAVENGNTEVVRKLISRNGCRVDAQNQWGYTALMKAAYYDYAEIAKLLLKDAGASPDITDDVGQTPLLIALTEGSHVTAECILKYGCDVTVTDRLGHSALYLAVHSPYNKSLDLAKRVFTSDYDVMLDESWLLNEEKHNLFYHDDAFYNRVCSTLKNKLNDSSNNKKGGKRVVRCYSIERSVPRTSRMNSGQHETSLEKATETTPEYSEEAPSLADSETGSRISDVSTNNSEANGDGEPVTGSDTTIQSKMTEQKQSNEGCGNVTRKNTQAKPDTDIKSPKDIINSERKLSLEIKNRSGMSARTVSENATGSEPRHRVPLVRRTTEELLINCAQATPKVGTCQRQMSVQCHAGDHTKKSETVQPPAAKVQRKTSLPAKPTVKFSTQILIYDYK